MADDQQAKAPAGMSAFFTRGQANEGVELKLHTPDGARTEHWIRIRGVDSDAFRTKDLELKRRAAEVIRSKLATLTPEEENELLTDQRLQLLSALVVSWSLPDECTPENVRTLLTEAPQIADSIDQLSSRRTLFFGRGPGPSSPSPSTSSGSG